MAVVLPPRGDSTTIAPTSLSVTYSRRNSGRQPPRERRGGIVPPQLPGALLHRGMWWFGRLPGRLRRRHRLARRRIRGHRGVRAVAARTAATTTAPTGTRLPARIAAIAGVARGRRSARSAARGATRATAATCRIRAATSPVSAKCRCRIGQDQPHRRQHRQQHDYASHDTFLRKTGDTLATGLTGPTQPKGILHIRGQAAKCKIFFGESPGNSSLKPRQIGRWATPRHAGPQSAHFAQGLLLDSLLLCR